MAIKPIGLSFKDTKEDMELYEWIISHSNKSGFIKDTLRASRGTNISKKENKNYSPAKNELIEMDF